jgi:hypothetical protein
VREEDGSWLLVRQADHAMLSGWLAAAWGAGPWEPPEPYGSAVVGARLHDLAWTPFDEALPLRPDGRPYAFIEVSRAIVVRFYAAGLDAVESIDPYAGLLNSLHYSGFYTSHWGWQHWARPERLEGEEREVIELFAARERERQQRLRDRLGVDGSHDRRLMCNYFWLQLWDRISLDICRYGFHGHAQDYPATPVGVGMDAPSVSLHLELEPGGTCRLDPYPLLADPYRAVLPATRVPVTTATQAGELRRAWISGPADAIEVTFRSNAEGT